jgi:hypothetical protein
MTLLKAGPKFFIEFLPFIMCSSLVLVAVVVSLVNATCNVAHEFGWPDHSSYFPNPSGFGPDESPLPSRANISLVNMLHRPRSRYPTTNASVQFCFGEKILLSIANGTSSFTGAFSFLNGWTYKPGAKVLVPVGYKKPFDSGVRFCYNPGQLYNTSTKITARTTTQDRILQSA